jgi:hypothetical protein
VLRPFLVVHETLSSAALVAALSTPSKEFELGHMRSNHAQVPSPALRSVPIVNVLTDLIFGENIAFLNLAFELISPAINDV